MRVSMEGKTEEEQKLLCDKAKEEVIYNMINTMLLRIHQSGHLAELSKERVELVKEGLQVYKNIREDIKEAIPFWPLDLAENEDKWLCAGIQTDKKAYLAVWKREMEGKKDNRKPDNWKSDNRKMVPQNTHTGQEPCEENNWFEIPLDSLSFAKEGLKVKLLYPQKEAVPFEVEGNALRVELSKPVMARLFIIEK